MNTKALRQKILDLAIHGKLVPQDPNDEPASVLLERIRDEKERLIKEGKTKRPKKIKTTSDKPHYENVPFEVPSSWVWCELGSVNEIARGGSPRPIKDYLTDATNGINWIKIGDTKKDGKYIDSVKEKIIPEGVKKSRMVHKGDFLLTNSMSFGRPYILNVDGCIHDGWLVISPLGKVYTSDFLYYLLSSSFAFEQFTNVASGGVVTNLNSDKVASTKFPLPPYEEQKRIVLEIEHWFALIDIIEHSKVNLQANIKFAKTKVLDLAIHGKLIPQDPTDEPASELLKRINPKAEITSDNGHYQKNKQFEIPSTWVLCKLGAVNEIARGGSPRPIKDYLTNDANGINWIKIGDTTKDGKYINSVKEKIRPEGVKKSRLVHKGDFLLTNSMSYGRPYILNVDGCIHDGWLVISPIGKAYTSDFLYYLLSSSFAYEQFTNVASGGVVTNLNSDKVADTIFPLPHYTEQERIVAKIEEIFAQLDAIEASL